jgi:hypothetical protein
MNRKTPTGRTPSEPNIQFIKPPMSPAALETVRQMREAIERQTGVRTARDCVKPECVHKD